MNSIEISKIMEDFDFQNVQNLLKSKLLSIVGGKGEVPSIRELEATAYDCLSTVVEFDALDCSTGGFIALYLTYPSGTKQLSLIYPLEISTEVKSSRGV